MSRLIAKKTLNKLLIDLGAKARTDFAALVARLKPCPFKTEA
jgi:hypothetical protein